ASRCLPGLSAWRRRLPNGPPALRAVNSSFRRLAHRGSSASIITRSEGCRSPGSLPLRRCAFGRRVLGRLAAGTAKPLDRDGRNAGLLRNEAVLLFEDRTGRLVTVEAPEHRTRHFAVRPLRTVLVEHIEHHVS